VTEMGPSSDLQTATLAAGCRRPVGRTLGG
jgi:hypothetical protein